MHASPEPAGKRWTLLADRDFRDFDEFAGLVRGWDLDLRPLQAGRSTCGLQQIASPELVVSRFRIGQSCDQRGSAPANSLTIGMVEAGAGEVCTPEGTITEDVFWCLPAGREFACVSQSDFRAYSLFLSETLLAEVSELCELPEAGAIVDSNGILRGRQPVNLHAIRNRLDGVFRDIKSSETELCFLQRKQEIEFDLAQQILEALAGLQEAVRAPMTHRRRLILRRALDYLEAHPSSPVTVYDLAQVAGAGLRTLEYVFRDYFGVTPKEYLTAQRLIGARRELQRSDAISTCVRDVANSWGFWHASRFSNDYRRFFGELPSQTLNMDQRRRPNFLHRNIAKHAQGGKGPETT